MTITARFDLKLDADDKEILSRAAGLVGHKHGRFCPQRGQRKGAGPAGTGVAGDALKA